MENATEEIVAPLGEAAWNDDALLDAFDNAVKTHGIDKQTKSNSISKEQTGKKKTKIIYKRSLFEDDEEQSDNNSEAYVATKVEKNTEIPSKETTPTTNPTESIPQPAMSSNPYMYAQQQPAQPAQSAQFAQFAQPAQPAQPTFAPMSMMPSVPDMEEQEALTQLLLAWYQAGYAAGRYASIRQRKL